MTTTTFPQNGQAATGLPFDSALRGATPAFHDGQDLALELLTYVATVQTLPDYSELQRQNMGRAALCGFLLPLLPLMAEALELFADDARAGLLAGLIEDVAHGAALALDQAKGGGGL